MKVDYKEINDLIFDKIIDMYGVWVKKYIILRNDTFAFAAVDGDVPVGFVSVTPRALPYPLEHLEDAFIEVLEVHENYRRQGIGQYLIKCSEDWAKKAGFKQIRTHHNDEAAGAIKLSHKLNYGMCPHDYWIEGTKYSGYWVAKVLSSQ